MLRSKASPVSMLLTLVLILSMGLVFGCQQINDFMSKSDITPVAPQLHLGNTLSYSSPFYDVWASAHTLD